MYAVIFKARIKTLDSKYTETAMRMRDLALHVYGCLEFVACTEGDREIAVSYWPDRESIRRWKSDPEHAKAQALGRSRWYSSYNVEVVDVIKAYSNEADSREQPETE